MSGFFTLVHLAALVSFIVFLVKSRKQKKAGEDNSLAKKIMIGSAIAWFVAFILIGATAPKVDTPEDASAEASSETTVAAPVEEKEAVTEATVEATTEENAASETASGEITEEEYLKQVNAAIDGEIGANESFTDVSLKNKVLTIVVDISKSNEGANIELPLEEIALSRASSITDAILELDVSLWDKVVVDFGDVGSVTKTKADIVESEYGKYFDITALDGQSAAGDTTSSITDTAANKQFIEDHATDIVVAAKLALDQFIDEKSYKLSLAPQKWTLTKFDDTPTTVIGTTDITYNDIKTTYIYVGTLEIDSSGKVTSAQPHYVAIGNLVLGDDHYCDEVFSKLGVGN